MKSESHIRHTEIRKVLLIALCFNLLAWGMKFLWGRWTGSISMQADGLHSLMDALSSIVGLVGVFAAMQPSDANHPYGHGKFEAVAAMGISVFVFLGSFEIVMESITRFREGAEPNVTPTSFVIMLVLMMLNGWLSRWEARIGTQWKSDILAADALHTRSDFYASLAVLIGFAGSTAGYPWVDPLAALAIAGAIGYAGIMILSDNVKVLTDSARINSKAVEMLVMGMEGILACHAIRTRGSRYHVYMDLHIHTAPDLPLASAHQLAHRVESVIMERFHEVSEVVVHLEPHLPDLEND